MSLTLNMVGGGSGGGLPANAAVLVVITFSGATVTLSKGGTSKTLNANEAHIVDADNDEVVYIVSIGSPQFGTWTVTAVSDGITQTKTVTIDSNEMYEVKVRARVPDEYQEVEYLKSSGSQHIITGANGTDIDGFDITFMYDAAYTSGGIHSIFGARASGTWTDITVYQNILQGSIYPPGDNNFGNFSSYNGIKYRFSGGAKFNWGFYVNGVLSIQGVERTNAPNKNLTLFTEVNNTNYTDARVSGKIYNAKLYSGQGLYSEFIPCYRKADSVAGMYDRVGKAFYTNSGSGTFTVGADV